MKAKVKKRDPIAKDVRTPKYKMRVVQPKKGKGSFKRALLLLDIEDKATEA